MTQQSVNMQESKAQEPLAILVSADDSYAMPLAVTLFSALEHLEVGEEVEVYIIDGGISKANQTKIAKILEHIKVKLKLVWLAPTQELIQGLPAAAEKRLSIATYFRLLAPYLITGSRIIYLDSDVIVNKNLSELWQTDLMGKPIAAALNSGFPTTGRGIINWREQSLKPDQPYFNAGVILMDLVQWREDKLAETVLENIRTNGDKYKFADQDALNAVFQDNFVELDGSWNAQVNDAVFISAPLPLDKIGIIHYTMNFKPWRWFAVGTTRPYHAQFFRVLKRSHWFSPAKYYRFRTHLIFGFISGLPGRIVQQLAQKLPAKSEAAN